MRILLLVMIATAAIGGLAACGFETKKADPNLLLPPGDRPAKGPGLFTGEDGVWTIDID